MVYCSLFIINSISLKNNNTKF